MIDAQGRWTAMDFQAIRKLPEDLKLRREAMEEHDRNVQMEIDVLETATTPIPP